MKESVHTAKLAEHTPNLSTVIFMSNLDARLANLPEDLRADVQIALASIPKGAAIDHLIVAYRGENYSDISKVIFSDHFDLTIEEYPDGDPLHNNINSIIVVEGEWTLYNSVNYTDRSVQVNHLGGPVGVGLYPTRQYMGIELDEYWEISSLHRT